MRNTNILEISLLWKSEDIRVSIHKTFVPLLRDTMMSISFNTFLHGYLSIQAFKNRWEGGEAKVFIYSKQ